MPLRCLVLCEFKVICRCDLVLCNSSDSCGRYAVLHAYRVFSMLCLLKVIVWSLRQLLH